MAKYMGEKVDDRFEKIYSVIENEYAQSLSSNSQ